MNRYLPWPYGAAAGACLGVLLDAQPWFWLLALLPLPLLAPPPWRLAAVALVVLAPAVWVRAVNWEARHTLPATGTMQLTGTSDGSTLHVTWPFRSSLAISPRGALPPGQGTVLAEVREAAGKRNPGGFDHASWLRARGISGQALIRETAGFTPVVTLAARMRQGVEAGLDEREAALMTALTLGQRDALADLQDDFKLAGMAHLLALSGLHLGVLVLGLRRLLRRLGAWHVPLLLIVAGGYVLLTGATPGMLRAAIMVGVLLLVELAGTGRVPAATSLALSLAITLLYRPAWLHDTGLQLSYGSVAGLLVFASPLAERLGVDVRAPAWSLRTLVAGGFASSVAAQLPTMSVVASSFGLVPLFSAVTNIIAVPLAGILVPLGNLAAVAGLLGTGLAAVINQLTGVVAGLMIRLASAAAHLPVLPWGEIEPSGHWYWLAACAALAFMLHRKLRPQSALCVCLAALVAVQLTPVRLAPPELLAIDVGQGDAFVLRFPGGTSVLVDAGGSLFGDFDPGASTVVPALRAIGVFKLDLLVSTHADLDHAGGLPAVLAAVPVQAVITGFPEPDREIFRALEAAAAAAGVPLIGVRRGQELKLGDATLRVLNPAMQPAASSNDNSVALQASWQGRSLAVLPAEVAADVELQLGAAPAEVLVVPHHGSRFSSSMALLHAVGGQTAVISVGRNNFGHPHPDVLDRLAQAGYEVRSTRDEGAVRLPLGTRR